MGAPQQGIVEHSGPQMGSQIQHSTRALFDHQQNSGKKLRIKLFQGGVIITGPCVYWFGNQPAYNRVNSTVPMHFGLQNLSWTHGSQIPLQKHSFTRLLQPFVYFGNVTLYYHLFLGWFFVCKSASSVRGYPKLTSPQKKRERGNKNDKLG